MIYKPVEAEEQRAMNSTSHELELFAELLEEKERRWLMAAYGVGFLAFGAGFGFCYVMFVL